jgi:hypothetical protein
MSKIALITGATSGIGKATAVLLAQQNYNLILIGRRTEKLEQLSQELRSTCNINTQTIALDVRDNADVRQKLEALPENWKAVDVLINNAGLSQGLAPIDQGDTTDWDVMIDTNVKGFLYVTKVVSQWMVSRRQGHIVNLGSIAGKETYLNGNVYCATKYAVDSLSQAMRIDLLPHRIKVTAINPGAVETEFSEVRFKGDSERAKMVYEGYQPLTPQDIAEAIWYAVSRPLNVNINDMVITPIAQANTSHLLRKL